MNHSIADMTLAEAASAIQRRDLGAEELVAACFKRIERDEPAVNAFIWHDQEAALAAARELDRQSAAAKELPPLHGIPLAHKDMFANRGKLATCGSKIRSEHRPEGRATAVARLEEAGAITIGGLNMAEFAQGPTGHNPHFGDCRNPWNAGYISGGSSSGSGAAVAARMVFGSLGSDTGGSVRIPAACCGVTGLKPTWSRVSRHGAMPLSFSMDCIGPLARTAEDCAILLQAIAGADAADATSSARSVPDYRAALNGNLRGLRIGIPRNGFAAEVDDAVQAAFEDALEVLEGRGASVCMIDLPAMDTLTACSAVVSRVELAACHAQWMRERADDYASSVSGRMYPNYAIPGALYVEALRRRASVLSEFAGPVFAKVDLLATPTIAKMIPTRAETDIESGAEGVVRRFLSPSQNTRQFSYLGLPAISIPCGFDPRGLPIGLQLAGRPFAEARLLRTADAFQRDTEWHRHAPAPTPM
ncbi:amidase [Chelativorans sp. Marseille-P2723]|uniref:amidase n=1 Tax=Chelativorans sp. Marseille-P2723 TaxID=2709133 RepID=UPI00156F4124|nr:amidase [Chelativorans sp. Marseille-P2723]